jgi:hypothetical protein
MPARPIIYLGMDVHKDSITIAVFARLGKGAHPTGKAPQRVAEAEEVDRAHRARRRDPGVL